MSIKGIKTSLRTRRFNHYRKQTMSSSPILPMASPDSRNLGCNIKGNVISVQFVVENSFSSRVLSSDFQIPKHDSIEKKAVLTDLIIFPSRDSSRSLFWLLSIAVDTVAISLSSRNQNVNIKKSTSVWYCLK